MNDLFAPQPWTMLEWDTSITIRCGKEMVCRCTNNARGKQYAKAIKALPEMWELLNKCELILHRWMGRDTCLLTSIAETTSVINEIQTLKSGLEAKNE